MHSATDLFKLMTHLIPLFTDYDFGVQSHVVSKESLARSRRSPVPHAPETIVAIESMKAVDDGKFNERKSRLEGQSS